MDKPTRAEIARQRNWLKARITGLIFIVPKECVTEHERNILKAIDEARKILLEQWEYSSRELDMKIKPQKDRFKED
jgi:hypothetical protein